MAVLGFVECAKTDHTWGAKTDGPGGAANTVIPALPPSDRRSPMDTPSADDCHRPVAPGWRAYDLTPQDVTPLIDRFISSFAPGPEDECWLWQGRTFQATGYGVISRSSNYEKNKHLLAHRVSWVAFNGKALTGNLTIDHLCNNRICVNPAHLEPVSLRENVRRKNERRGYNIGVTKRRERTERTRLPARPITDDEDRRQRARDRALAYYYANREQILAARRERGFPSPPVSCEECGLQLRHDGLRRHQKRKHGAA